MKETINSFGGGCFHLAPTRSQFKVGGSLLRNKRYLTYKLTSGRTFNLYFHGTDRDFFNAGDDTEIVFKFDANGNVEGFRLFEHGHLCEAVKIK
jgi:hypothetical protein